MQLYIRIYLADGRRVETTSVTMGTPLILPQNPGPPVVPVTYDTEQRFGELTFQNGDFFLIGKDQNSYSRYSGEGTNVSCNYLTCKQKTVTSNVFNRKVKRKEVWTKLPKSPLLRLGDFTVE